MIRIYFIISFFIFIINLILLDYYEKRSILNNSDDESIMISINEMLLINKIGIIKIKKGNIFSFNPITSEVTIKEKFNNTLAYFIACLHEIGHYIAYKSNSITTQITKISLLFITVNRVIIIPSYMITFFLFLFGLIRLEVFFIEIILKNIFSVLFIIGAIFRITIGIFEEYKANIFVLEYLYLKKPDIEIVEVKKIMRLAIGTQFFLAMSWILCIMYIHSILFIL